MALSRNTLRSGPNYDITPTVEARAHLIELYLAVDDDAFAAQVEHYPIADMFICHWLFGIDFISQPKTVAELAKEKTESLYADSRVLTLTAQ
jgi:hypothetical protein